MIKNESEQTINYRTMYLINNCVQYRIMYLINHCSDYKIMKHTNLYENTLSRLRHHKASVNNIALHTAALLDYMAVNLYSPAHDVSLTVQQVANNVVKVITSHLSAYFLSKHIDVPYSVINNLRVQRSSIPRLYLQSALAISDFYQKHPKLVKQSIKKPVYITQDMFKNARKLITSDCSSYRVAKHVGLQPSVTSRLFRGVTSLRKARPKTVYLLSHYYIIHHNDADVQNNNVVRA